jgi:hypothetical protein
MPINSQSKRKTQEVLPKGNARSFIATAEIEPQGLTWQSTERYFL